MSERLVLVVVALVGLSGCGAASLGGESAGTPTETLTPAPVPSTEVPTSTRIDGPPGVTTNRGINLTRLEKAHDAFLDGRSYEWTLTYNVSSGSPFRSPNFTKQVVVDGDRFFIQHREDGYTESLFVDETTGYYRVVDSDRTRTTSILPPDDARDYIWTESLISRYLAGTNPAVSTVQRDGETYYRLHSTDRPSELAGSRSAVTNYRVTAYVTPDGFVVSMVARYHRAWNDSRDTVFFRFDYSKVDTATVERPDWVDGIQPRTPGPALKVPSNSTPTTSVTPASEPASESPT